MKKFLIICQLLCLFSLLQAQSKLTLEECKQKAVDNYPLIKQYDLIALSEDYSLNNLTKNYLPQFALNGQASYQSEVTTIPLDLSFVPGGAGIQPMSKDQYKAVIEASQLIWDGGMAGSQRKVTKADSEVNSKKVEVGLYAIKEKINQLFFGILAIDEQLRILDSAEKDLKTNRDVVNSMLRNGVAMQSDLDRIDVEILNIDGTRTGQTTLREAYIKMLSLFINQELNPDYQLEKPVFDNNQTERISRPELSLYDSQRSFFDAQNSVINSKNMPRLSLFAQGGYGKPGFNMLTNEFKFYAIGGVRLIWNFGNMYTNKNEKRLLNNSIKNIDIQQDVFLFNTNLQLTQEQKEIEKSKKLMEKDDEIINLRNRIKTSAESKYKNGVYLVNELIRDINDENQARQTKALHEIQYLMSLYNYKHIQGE
jgi:outer membrane protein TolC